LVCTHLFGSRSRACAIANRLDAAHPDVLTAQFAWLVNAAVESSELLATDDATQILLVTANAGVAGEHEAE